MIFLRISSSFVEHLSGLRMDPPWILQAETITAMAAFHAVHVGGPKRSELAVRFSDFQEDNRTVAQWPNRDLCELRFFKDIIL